MANSPSFKTVKTSNGTGLFAFVDENSDLHFPEQCKIPVDKFVRKGARLEADVTDFAQIAVPSATWEEERAVRTDLPWWIVPAYFDYEGKPSWLDNYLCVVLKDGRELPFVVKEVRTKLSESGDPPTVLFWSFIVYPRYYQIDGRGQGLRRATVYNENRLPLLK